MLGALLALALLSSSDAPANTAAPTAAAPAADAPAAPAATAKPKVNRDAVVCHTEEVLGSRISKKVCYTPAEAEDRARQDQRNLDHMQSGFGYNRN
jgi:hypothetical protein